MKKLKMIMMAVLAIFVSYSSAQAKSTAGEKVIVAYVTSWSQVIPNPEYMTHINYAFGHVSETFNGVGIANDARLRQIVELKNRSRS